MPSRRTTLLGLLGLSSSLVADRTLAKRGERWVSHNGAVDGSPDSYFSFGTFNGAPQYWTTHNAGHPYSCQLSGDGEVLRLELHAGDQWPDEAIPGSRVERTMVQPVTGPGSHQSQALPMATDVWWAFSFLIEPGPPVSSLGPGYAWLIFADVHSDFNASHAHAVPIQFECDAGDQFVVQAHGTKLHPDGAVNEIDRQTSPIARGRWHEFVTRLNIDPSGEHAAADVFLDGEQVVTFRGPLGFEGDLPYPQFQIYRGNPHPQTLTHESVAVRYTRHELVTSGNLVRRIGRPRGQKLRPGGPT
jgi:hypothetical protein